MKDHNKTKKQLLSEIKDLREKIAHIETADNQFDNELHYRELFENHAFLVYITDIMGNILLSNEKAAKFIRHKKSEKLIFCS